ncbi:TRAP transporter small permease [Cyclobacterium marinum]|uniref:Tripartite ATP-independent periplasmic transporter DctQ component n=1 Tax=Cyclobacterium marinum (strain ATCC 25205 / DSM 745 / LMG 13164 / NCIMB 1802) TaxID=880070 RepID=G0J5C2_CYCMS|nr:TRAP transporter small permease [Cyclobacterium marinum]AEL27558.1 Tripartite ATP-independent periplasmic transporter DctQ component [Cyclobacterium marinum DSM 745]MBI0397328.1 TRAP transporter small permease [Cyclobacterium marinum]|tara:strand:- start:31295 stop:31783 length:489 start_codon:yes stop_codon:yes gene_type:complete
MVSFKSKLDKVVGVMLMVIMAVMVMNVTWQVFSRYVIQSPSSFTDELSRYLLVWLGMLGAAYVAGQGNHLAIDILPTKLTGEAKRKLLMVINVVIILFVIPVMIMGGTNLVYITFILEQKSATLQLPLAYVYMMIPFSGLLVLFYQLVDLKILMNQKNSQNS